MHSAAASKHSAELTTGTDCAACQELGRPTGRASVPGFVGRSRTEAACASHLEWQAALAEGGTYTELAKGGACARPSETPRKLQPNPMFPFTDLIWDLSPDLI